MDSSIRTKMMISNGIDWFANELMRKNITVAWLYNKAKMLPYCRENILITIITCWDKHITLLAYDIISGRHCSIYDINFRCKKFIEEKNIANKNFTNFFFAIHESLVSLYKKRLHDVINLNVDIKAKISALFALFFELMNLTRIEAECFEIDCEVLGNSCICGEHICKQEPNIITLMVTDEMVDNPEVLETIVDGFKHIKEPNKVILVVDYRNLCAYKKYYSWEESNAYCRYKKIKKYVKDVYFYKADCVDFGKYYNELKDKIIRGKKAYKEFKRRWRELNENKKF